MGPRELGKVELTDEVERPVRTSRPIHPLREKWLASEARSFASFSSTSLSSREPKTRAFIANAAKLLDIESERVRLRRRQRQTKHLVKELLGACFIPCFHCATELVEHGRFRIAERLHRVDGSVVCVGIAAYILRWRRSPFDPDRSTFRDMAKAAYGFELHGRRVVYRVKKPWFHGSSSLPVRVETRFVNLQTGAEGVEREELVQLAEQDLAQYVPQEGKGRPSPFDLQVAAEAALAYAMALRGYLKDLRDVATAWVVIIVRDHGLRPRWPGRRAHMARAMRLVFDDEIVTATEVQQKSDAIVSVASEMWERLKRVAERRPD